MNKRESDIFGSLAGKTFIGRKGLSTTVRYSLQEANECIKSARLGGCPGAHLRNDSKAKPVRNAIILAAGFGMRMVPINTACPKALVEVKGELLIERTIKQLHEAGVTEIHIVVGFMKEMFDYLVDEYGVNLIVNEDYASKNNLHSLALASSLLSNSYVIPSDIWCAENPYSKYELNPWYMVSDSIDKESNLRANRRGELLLKPGAQSGNAMLGIALLLERQSCKVRDRLKTLDGNSRYDGAYWEEALFENNRMIVPAKVVSAKDATEINTYEQLRDLDNESDHLKSDAINIIASTFSVESSEVVDIAVLKKGMTNRSFLFSCRGKKYIMRIPGEGTDRLINRREEAEVYRAISGKNVCDDIAYINPANGYKITEYLENSRVCDPENADDIKASIEKLRNFHKLGISVDHEFNIFDQIEFYESLWNGVPSAYRDYQRTKSNVMSLKKYIDEHVSTRCLTHIDAVPDNFLFTKDGDVRLIDWEYAGMQDPHVDIAMFCIYALYKKRQVDRLIDIYFENKCPRETRLKIYCYIASCGLLWSNWCEYKRCLGIEFGEYSLRQYRYAKDYFKIVMAEGVLNESD